MSKKNHVIFVPRANKIAYTNTAGENVEVTLQSNREYEIKTKDGVSHVMTIGGVSTEKQLGGKVRIRGAVNLTAGFMNVQQESTTVLEVSDIVEVNPVKIDYLREKRSYKNAKNRPDAQGFTFTFDINKSSQQYRITVYAGEFIALATRLPTKAGAKPETRTYYGHIDEVTDTEVVMTRYMTTNGVRSLQSNYRIKIEDLLGIYRYALGITVGEPKPDPGDVADEAGVPEPTNEAEETEQASE